MFNWQCTKPHLTAMGFTAGYMGKNYNEIPSFNCFLCTQNGDAISPTQFIKNVQATVELYKCGAYLGK